MALAITPPGEFGDLPYFGKASNRGSRPLFGSDRSAQQGNTIKSGDGMAKSTWTKLYKTRKKANKKYTINYFKKYSIF